MKYSSLITLNKSGPSKIIAEQPIDIALTFAMADLKAKFINVERGLVHYKAIRGSDAFERYMALTDGLREFDLRSLANREHRLAFWINIYNTAVIHGVIELGLESSGRDYPRFFDRVAYEIGGYVSL